MMPVKIKILENERDDFESGLNITVLGVGEQGREAVSEYPFYIDRKTHGIIKDLTFCYDYNLRYSEKFSEENIAKLRRQTRNIIKKTELLFVVADATNESDFKSFMNFANLHRKSELRDIFTVLIDVNNSSIQNKEVGKAFDLIISTDGFEPYRPIKMIISDMFCGCCGLDYSCIKYVLDIMTNAKFYKQKYSNLNKMREMILSLGEKIKEDKDENDTINALVLFALPEEAGLENIEEVFVALDNVIDGDVIWQGYLNSDKNDESCTITIIYGKGNKL